MIEIVILVFVCRAIGGVVRKKGRAAWPFYIMTVVFWFGGEFAVGFVIGVMKAMNGNAATGEFDMSLYLFALLGAAAGAGLAFLIAALVPPKTPVAPSYGPPPGWPQYPPPFPPQHSPPPANSSNPYNPYSE